MNDWMTTDTAWMHVLGMETPIKGTIVHSANHSNNRAWFVPDGDSINCGCDLLDEEGVADDGGVWYMHEVSRETALCAFKDYFKHKLWLAENDVRYYKNRLKGLGCDIENEEGAE